MIRYQFLLLLTVGFISLFGCSDPETATYERFYFRHNNADLAVEVNGNLSGKNFILFLHGGPGGGAYNYNYGLAADLLEEQYAIAYMDQRGHGASKGNYKKSNVTLQTNSEDIYALTRFLKQKYGQDIKVFLMGHSWGGMTGTHALLNTPLQQEVDGWIEVAGAHDIPLLNVELVKMFIEIGGQEIAAGRNVSAWQERVDFAKSLDTSRISRAQSLELNILAHNTEDLFDNLNEGDQGSGFSHGLFKIPTLTLGAWFANILTANAYDKEIEETAMTDRLGEIEVPTLLLYGKYDFVVPLALGTSALEKLPEAELVVFEKSAHGPMANEPHKYVNTVIDFIEKHQ